MKLRHQLSAYSPIRLRAVIDGMLAVAGMRRSAPTALRDRLLERYAANDCILCGSGTQALQQGIKLAACGSRRGGFVALPAFNCYDMASAALGAGLAVSLYDVDPATLAPDPDSFERVLSAGASVAVLAYLYGVPFNWRPFAAIAERYDVPLIEDAAQGHGASWCGVPLGTLGPASIISFGRGKGWTGGGGGALLLRDATATREPGMRNAASDARVTVGLAAQWLLGRPALYGLPRSIPWLALGDTVYHPPAVVSAISNASAAAALSNESAATEEAERRAVNARHLSLGLLGTRARLISVPSGAEAGYIRLPVLLANGLASLPRRAGALGVSPSYPITLAALPALRAVLVDVEETFPGADLLARELVTLPTHSMLSERERNEVLDVVRSGV